MTDIFIFLLVITNPVDNPIIVEQPSLTVCQNQIEHLKDIVNEDITLECILIEQDQVII